VTILYDDCARVAELYPAVIDLIRSRDSETARFLARQALEALDDSWSRRHPPPSPVPVPGLAATVAAPEGRTKVRKSRRAIPRSA
jgi:hypothetical protein